MAPNNQQAQSETEEFQNFLFLQKQEFTMTSSEGLLVCVQQPRKLKQLAKEGWIEYPSKYGGGVQISEGTKNICHFERYEPTWGLELKYRVKYIDGSIYPYLFYIKPKYGGVYQYGHYY